jgi:peptide/nickel transport system substrate-binding protein
MMKKFITESATFIFVSLISLNATYIVAAERSIKIGMQLEPPNLNPTAGAAAAIDEVVYANLFEGLTRFNRDGAIKPSLAKSWKISRDEKQYTFFLNKNVTFHDGSSMDSMDVKFSLDRARSTSSTNAQKALFEGITSIEILSPTSLKVILEEPNGNFITNLAWGDAVIVSEDSIHHAETNPIGTGPYKFSKWIRGDRVELKKYDAYWGNQVHIENIIFKFIPDPTAAFAAMMAGDIDAFPVFPAPENLAQFSSNPQFKVMVGTTEGETILSTNNKKPPFDNILIRKALAHAINRKEIIDGAMFGYGTPIGTHFAPHNPNYIDLTNFSKFNPKLSKKILEEENYDNSLPISLKLPPPSYARRGGEIVASQLRRVGFNIEISNLEWAQWLEQVFKGKDYNLTIVSHTEPSDINIYARPNYYFQYNNSKFQDLIFKLNLTSNQLKRQKILHSAQKMLSEQYVNGYLFQLAKTGVADSRIKGLWKNSPTQANDLTEVSWID